MLAYELARRLLRGGPVPLLAPLTWHIQGSLLANVDRLLREIDLERGPDARRVRRR